ncbi:hypothetical protein K2173_027859 [Erythroxylum novogranatense]|uniref:Bromo domain-containing protein n=1 Tax=Erythroxylum novogranatense TaxID=1862640 RepID=A0AAV8U0B4_9ROSI|nr:hypothetical protein K2173_027859 [Erythroxylum novogranatense]
MGDIGTRTMTRKKKKKKKGRPSLLDLQKRSLKEQQQRLLLLQNPNSQTRSARRNPNSDDDDDDERIEKKHKLLLGLNSHLNHHHYSSHDDLYGFDNLEAAVKRRKITDGSDNTVGKAVKATDTLHGSPVEPGPTPPLPDKKLLIFILDRLQKKDTYGVFSEPVDPEELPDYHDIVEQPMDFATVRKKLDDGAYGNLEQFEKDVFLICSNAMQYNSADTIYFRQARTIQELAKKDFENLRQDSDDGEPRPKVVRRGRPPGKSKKSLEKSPFDRIASEISSDASPATAGDNASVLNGYNLRKTTSSKNQPSETSFRASYLTHSNETYASWLSEWENEFPASVLKAVLKYGKKPYAVDENRRNTYKQPATSMFEPSVFAPFEGELKQLMVVGLNSEHGYARSLSRFAADLGPVAWKFASKKIQSVLPVDIEFGRGWVGQHNSVEGQHFSVLDQQRSQDTSALDSHKSNLQPLNVSCPNSLATSRDDMAETVSGLSSPSERSSLNTNITLGGINQVPSFPNQQNLMITSDVNGLSYGFGNKFSTQMGIARPRTPQGFSIASSCNSTLASVPGNYFTKSSDKSSETSNGLLPSGISSTMHSGTESHVLLNVGLGGNLSWQGFLPHHLQDSLPCAPDLNVGFLAPSSPASGMPISSPQQPDLALQL